MLSWCGWAFAFGGIYLLTRFKWKGFVLCLAADILLMVDAWLMDYWSLFVACWLFVGIHLYGIYKWRYPEYTVRRVG